MCGISNILINLGWVTMIEQEDNEVGIDVKQFPALAVLYPDELHFFNSIAIEVELAADVPVISEGQTPEGLYLIRSGLLVVNKRHDNSVYEVGSVTPGELFGEASILYGQPAGAEVRTTEAASLYQLPTKYVMDVLENNQRFLRALSQLAERRMAGSALAINPSFSQLPQAVREILLYNAKFVSLEKDEVLLREGDSDTSFMFLVLSGEAEASIKHPTDPEKRIVFARIGAGDEVGEISVITERPHAATVIATKPLRLLAIKCDSVQSWRQRYSDFGYSLYACVQRKLSHSLEAVRKVAGDKAAEVRKRTTMLPRE
ncbi:MAG: cyclic nucleotide-binding domain-containing protein [Mariprofundaceae bacterium]